MNMEDNFDFNVLKYLLENDFQTRQDLIKTKVSPAIKKFFLTTAYSQESLKYFLDRCFLFLKKKSNNPDFEIRLLSSELIKIFYSFANEDKKKIYKLFTGHSIFQNLNPDDKKLILNKFLEFLVDNQITESFKDFLKDWIYSIEKTTDGKINFYRELITQEEGVNFNKYFNIYIEYIEKNIKENSQGFFDSKEIEFLFKMLNINNLKKIKKEYINQENFKNLTIENKQLETKVTHADPKKNFEKDNEFQEKVALLENGIKYLKYFLISQDETEVNFSILQKLINYNIKHSSSSIQPMQEELKKIAIVCLESYLSKKNPIGFNNIDSTLTTMNLTESEKKIFYACYFSEHPKELEKFKKTKSDFFLNYLELKDLNENAISKIVSLIDPEEMINANAQLIADLLLQTSISIEDFINLSKLIKKNNLTLNEMHVYSRLRPDSPSDILSVLSFVRKMADKEINAEKIIEAVQCFKEIYKRIIPNLYLTGTGEIHDLIVCTMLSGKKILDSLNVKLGENNFRVNKFKKENLEQLIKFCGIENYLDSKVVIEDNEFLIKHKKDIIEIYKNKLLLTGEDVMGANADQDGEYTKESVLKTLKIEKDVLINFIQGKTLINQYILDVTNKNSFIIPEKIKNLRIEEKIKFLIGEKEFNDTNFLPKEGMKKENETRGEYYSKENRIVALFKTDKIFEMLYFIKKLKGEDAVHNIFKTVADGCGDNIRSVAESSFCSLNLTGTENEKFSLIYEAFFKDQFSLLTKFSPKDILSQDKHTILKLDELNEFYFQYKNFFNYIKNNNEFLNIDKVLSYFQGDDILKLEDLYVLTATNDKDDIITYLENKYFEIYEKFLKNFGIFPHKGEFTIKKFSETAVKEKINELKNDEYIDKNCSLKFFVKKYKILKEMLENEANFKNKNFLQQEVNKYYYICELFYKSMSKEDMESEDYISNEDKKLFSQEKESLLTKDEGNLNKEEKEILSFIKNQFPTCFKKFNDKISYQKISLWNEKNKEILRVIKNDKNIDIDKPKDFLKSKMDKTIEDTVNKLKNLDFFINNKNSEKEIKKIVENFLTAIGKTTQKKLDLNENVEGKNAGYQNWKNDECFKKNLTEAFKDSNITLEDIPFNIISKTIQENAFDKLDTISGRKYLSNNEKKKLGARSFRVGLLFCQLNEKDNDALGDSKDIAYANNQLLIIKKTISNKII